jgi:hypothetical protein
MKAIATSWIVLLVPAAAVTMLVDRGRREAARQAVALAAAHQQNLRLFELDAENRRMQAAQASAEERARLQSGPAEAEALSAKFAELRRRIADADAGSDSNGDRVAIPVESWTYAGRASPRDALRSVLWSASHGDVERLADLLGFAPDVRPQAEALYAQLPAASQQEYGRPEKVVATLLAGSFPKDASAMTLLNGTQLGETAVVAMRVDHSDGQSRTNGFLLQRAPGGWQLMVPASVMAGYEKMLKEGPQYPEGAAP